MLLARVLLHPRHTATTTSLGADLLVRTPSPHIADKHLRKHSASMKALRPRYKCTHYKTRTVGAGLQARTVLSRLLWPPWEGEAIFATLRSRKQCQVHWWVNALQKVLVVVFVTRGERI